MNKFVLAVAAAMLVPAAYALDFSFDNGITLDLDTTLTYGAQWRVESRKSSIGADAFLDALADNPFLPLTDERYSRQQTVLLNGDDGNNNFDTGLISNRLTMLLEMDARWQNYGLFVRGRAYYDEVYKDSDTDLDASGFRTYNSGSLYGGAAGIGDFPSKTRDEHGAVVEFLDVFAYATWDIPGERLLDLRIGRQVINWGESTFYQGINSIQNRADARAANTPGVEVKEILLPTGAIYGQVDLLPNLTVEAYYQYEWLENELNGVGSYFSINDQIGPGSNSFIIPTPGSPVVPKRYAATSSTCVVCRNCPTRRPQTVANGEPLFTTSPRTAPILGFTTLWGTIKNLRLSLAMRRFLATGCPSVISSAITRIYVVLQSALPPFWEKRMSRVSYRGWTVRLWSTRRVIPNERICSSCSLAVRMFSGRRSLPTIQP